MKLMKFRKLMMNQKLPVAPDTEHKWNRISWRARESGRRRAFAKGYATGWIDACEEIHDNYRMRDRETGEEWW